MEGNKNQPQYPLWPGSNFQRPSAFPPFGAYQQPFRMQYNLNTNAQPRPNAFMMNNMYNMQNGMPRAPLPPTPPELPNPVPAPDDIPLPEGPPPEKPPLPNVAPPHRFQMMNLRQQNSFTPFPLKKKKQKKKAFKPGGTWANAQKNTPIPPIQQIPPPAPMPTQPPPPTPPVPEPAQQANNLLSSLSQWPPKLK